MTLLNLKSMPTHSFLMKFNNIVVAILFLASFLGCDESKESVEIRKLFSEKGHTLHTITIHVEAKAKYLPFLHEIQELRKLNIGGKWVTAKHIEQLSKIDQLEEIDVKSVNLTGKELQTLGQLDNLLRLKIYNAPELDDNIFDTVANMKLTELVITGAVKLEGVGINKLANNKTITSLDLNGNNITDEATTTIATLSQLKRLNITHTKITEVGVRRLLVLVNLDDYQGPDLPKATAIEFAKIAIEARQKARADGKTTAPDNIAPYASVLEK